MPSSTSSRPSLPLLATALLALSPTSAAATQTTDLCTGNPCVVTGSKTVEVDVPAAKRLRLGVKTRFGPGARREADALILRCLRR